MLDKYLVVILWAMTLAVTCLTISSIAYVLTGDRWPEYKISPLYYWDFSGYSEFHVSAADWRAAPVRPDPLQHPKDPEYAYFYIHQVNVEEGWSGVTVIKSENGVILTADVYLNSYWFDGWGSGARRSTCAHEIGHVLGLNEEPDVTLRALMYPYHNIRWDIWRINTPQNDDVEGVNAIYGAP